MLHGQRLVLLVYLHLTLVVQYNIILIIINSIYTILLFANKQWGKYNIGEGTDAKITATLSISYKYWYKPFISVENASNSMIGYFIKDLNSFLILRGVNDTIARTGFFLTIGN